MTDIAFHPSWRHSPSSVPEPGRGLSHHGRPGPIGAVDFRTGDDKIKVFIARPSRVIPALATIR
jgi:hypothetical protein